MKKYTAFIIQSVNRGFNLNRIERYLTICNQASIETIVIISKTDLIGKNILNDRFYKNQNF